MDARNTALEALARFELIAENMKANVRSGHEGAALASISSTIDALNELHNVISPVRPSATVCHELRGVS